MPAFVLYGSRGSTNTDRVRLTLAEGGFTDFETVLLDLRKSEQKSPENLQRHPWGKVPSIAFPDGLTLFESRVICKYLARKYSFPLLPLDNGPDALALFDQAEAVEQQYFAKPAGKIGFELFAKRMMNLPADEKVVQAALKHLNSFFDIAERLLTKDNYMAGSTFSLIDIYYIPLVQRMFACGYGDLVTSRKTVNAWWTRVTGRPAISKLLAADREAMAAAMKAS